MNRHHHSRRFISTYTSCKNYYIAEHMYVYSRNNVMRIVELDYTFIIGDESYHRLWSIQFFCSMINTRPYCCTIVLLLLSCPVIIVRQKISTQCNGGYFNDGVVMLVQL